MPICGFAGSVAPVQIEVRGRDLDEMNCCPKSLIAKLGEFPFILNPDLSWHVGQPEVADLSFQRCSPSSSSRAFTQFLTTL